MNRYAIVKINGHQYRISEGQEILVDKLNGKPESKILLVVDNGKVLLGKPEVEKAKVSYKVLKDEKGVKIDVRKYKSKSRYRKHIGFRPKYTRLLVEKISI